MDEAEFDVERDVITQSSPKRCHNDTVSVTNKWRVFGIFLLRYINAIAQTDIINRVSNNMNEAFIKFVLVK